MKYSNEIKIFIKAIYVDLYIFLFTKFKRIKILDSRQTIEYIEKNNCSFGRFGDCEMDILFGRTVNNYQTYSDELHKKLKEINTNQNFLFCLPIYLFIPYCKLNFILKKKYAIHWQKYKNFDFKNITNLIRDKKIIGNTNLTRPYFDFKNKPEIFSFGYFKSKWENKEVLIIEGQLTRFGYKNSLLDNCTKIKRILGPSTSSFCACEKIYNYVIKNIDKSVLILAAMGPSATILAFELSKNGYTVYDVGHLDVEFEWFINGCQEKKALKYKYVNEALDGHAPEIVMPNDYLTQIEADFSKL